MSERMTWPNGATCAVALTFDFDAESLWLANDPAHKDLPATLSIGRYGAKVGVPKILELLRDEDIGATFFVPGWTVDNHTDRVEAVLAAGHEIGHHGYTHRAPDPNDPAMVEDEIDRGLAALESRLGVRPSGYRPPDGMSSELSLRLLTERGFTYNSCFKDDYLPYRHRLADGSPGPVELPEQPTLDDWAFGSSSLANPRPLFTKDHVLSIWQDEFRELHDWGGLFMLVMHPQVTGRPIRLATLRELIAFMRGFPGVWFATSDEIARAFIDHESDGDSGQAVS